MFRTFVLALVVSTAASVWATPKEIKNEVFESLLTTDWKYVHQNMPKNYSETKVDFHFLANGVRADLLDTRLLYVPVKKSTQTEEVSSIYLFDCYNGKYTAKNISYHIFNSPDKKGLQNIGMSIGELLNHYSPTRDNNAIAAWYKSLRSQPMISLTPTNLSHLTPEEIGRLAVYTLVCKDQLHSVNTVEQDKENYYSTTAEQDSIISRIKKDFVRIKTEDKETIGYIAKTPFKIDSDKQMLYIQSQSFTLRDEERVVEYESHNLLRVFCPNLSLAAIDTYLFLPGRQEKIADNLERNLALLEAEKLEVFDKNEEPQLYKAIESLCQQYKMTTPK